MTQHGLSDDSKYPFPLSVYGRVRILGVLLCEKASALLDAAMQPTALVAISRVADASGHPLDWSTNLLSAVEEAPSELRRASTSFKRDALDVPRNGGSLGTGASGNADEGEYRPASWFVGKASSARLRMAARPGRKTKRVRKRMTEGVVCYSVDDVQKWWPELLPK